MAPLNPACTRSMIHRASTRGVHDEAAFEAILAAMALPGCDHPVSLRAAGFAAS
jgi:hypothetical protein